MAVSICSDASTSGKGVAVNDSRMPTVPSLSRLVAIGRERIRARAEILAIAGAGLLAIAMTTALDWRAALLSFAAVVGYALLRDPRRQFDGRAFPSRSSSADQGAERQALVDAMPDPAWVLDDARVVLSANAPARGIFPSLRPGIHVASAVRSPDVIEAVDRAFATGVVQNTALHERVPIERRLAVVVAPLRAAGRDSGARSVLLTLRDLTEQDRLAQMRADFVANASHELRTPLASLRGFVETLQGPARNDPAARERFLAIMSTQADRMTRLIDDLLSLSRVEMHQHLAPTAMVDLADVATQAIQGLEPQAVAAKILLSFETDTRPAMVRGDRDELLQVLQNLIQNALKYGREGGKVDVRIKRTAGTAGRPSRIEVSVRDNGPGIAAEHIPRLTERFYRVNASQSRDKGGTGLGLAIVKHIVSRHGGELLITSEIGVGSTFAFFIDEAKATVKTY
jgi:two-component system, OmpR family, phosphate regulon sensor histidine kinase PhoR